MRRTENALPFRRKSRIFSGEVREILDDIALQHIRRGRELFALFPRKADVARAARRGDRYQRDMVTADTVPCDARREGYTEAGADEFTHCHRAITLEYHVRHESRHAAIEVCDGTKGRTGFQRNESCFLKFIQVYRRFSGMRIRVRHSQHDVLFEERHRVVILDRIDGGG